MFDKLKKINIYSILIVFVLKTSHESIYTIYFGITPQAFSQTFVAYLYKFALILKSVFSFHFKQCDPKTILEGAEERKGLKEVGAVKGKGLEGRFSVLFYRFDCAYYQFKF